jgi:hypothetical protein
MTASEQRLAMGLGIVLIAGSAFIGLTKMKSWKLRVDAQAIEVASRKLEAETLMEQKQMWQQRSEWLTEKLPAFTRRGEVDNQFLELLQSTSSAHGVSLSQTQPVTPTERIGLTSSSFNVQAQGEWAAMNHWLHDLQKPDAYVRIPSLTLSSNEQDTKEVTVNMNIQKWFRLPSP